jgi:hypothetical protein
VGIEDRKKLSKMVAKLLQLISVSPYKNGVLIALAVALIVILLSVFRPLKSGQQPSAASQAITSNKHSPFFRLMELFGAIFCVALLIAFVVSYGNILSLLAWLMIIGLLITAGTFSILVLYWVAKSDK